MTSAFCTKIGISHFKCVLRNLTTFLDRRFQLHNRKFVVLQTGSSKRNKVSISGSVLLWRFTTNRFMAHSSFAFQMARVWL